MLKCCSIQHQRYSVQFVKGPTHTWGSQGLGGKRGVRSRTRLLMHACCHSPQRTLVAQTKARRHNFSNGSAKLRELPLQLSWSETGWKLGCRQEERGGRGAQHCQVTPKAETCWETLNPTQVTRTLTAYYHDQSRALEKPPLCVA
eukprot:363506-Chlamydomonas_euryale.AAC.10